MKPKTKSTYPGGAHNSGSYASYVVRPCRSKKIKMEKFTHKNEEFEVMIGLKNQSETFIQVIRTSNRLPVNKRIYSVSWETRMDMTTMIGLDAVKELMKIAKSDIINDVGTTLKESERKTPRSLNNNGEIEWQ